MTLQPSWTGYLYCDLWVFGQDTRLRLGSFVIWDGGACYTKKYHVFEETSCLHLQDTRWKWPEYPPLCEYQISWKKHGWSSLWRTEQNRTSCALDYRAITHGPFLPVVRDSPDFLWANLLIEHVNYFSLTWRSSNLFSKSHVGVSMQVQYGKFTVLR